MLCGASSYILCLTDTRKDSSHGLGYTYSNYIIFVSSICSCAPANEHRKRKRTVLKRKMLTVLFRSFPWCAVYEVLRKHIFLLFTLFNSMPTYYSTRFRRITDICATATASHRDLGKCKFRHKHTWIVIIEGLTDCCREALMEWAEIN